MSHKKPIDEYISEVKSFGTGARISANKEHIGKKAYVKILNDKITKELKK